MKKFGGASSKGGGQNLSPLLGIGLPDLPKIGWASCPPVSASLVLSLRYHKEFYDTADKYDLVPRYIEKFKDTN